MIIPITYFLILLWLILLLVFNLSELETISVKTSDAAYIITLRLIVGLFGFLLGLQTAAFGVAYIAIDSLNNLTVKNFNVEQDNYFIAIIMFGINLLILYRTTLIFFRSPKNR